mmetsp:Transcript_35508/g.59855  ORF Transcript_35508/g.59855 Transcript_35508/m.59855 type:complete len:80 (-) Transcript_35508:903-1142(-)
MIPGAMRRRAAAAAEDVSVDIELGRVHSDLLRIKLGSFGYIGRIGYTVRFLLKSFTRRIVIILGLSLSKTRIILRILLG